MSEYHRDLRHVPQSEDELEQQLSDYGPLMAQQEQFEAEIDHVFATRLRAHLMDTEELAPHPTFARNLRSRLLRRSGARPVHNPRSVSRRRSIGISALATTALLVFVLLRLHHGSGPQTSSFSAPYPQRADLLFNLPPLHVTIHRLTATLSLVHPASGVPYAGHLRLTAPALPHEPPNLPAYRLAVRSGAIARDRGVLNIASPVRHEIVDGVAWLVAQEGGVSVHRPLHSLAISTRSGELIYHDRRNRLLPFATHPITERRAFAIAQEWLAVLGWPGHRMTLRSFHRVPGMTKVRAVELGWPQVGLTATNAATLWITPNGSVIEAWVWPPIAHHGIIPTRPVTQAWNQVRHGTLPIAVQGISPFNTSGGIGTLHRTQIVSILTFGKGGALYLVPAYRFNGTVRIIGTNDHSWVSLSPSMAR